MLFSATLSYGVMELAYEYMNNPEEVFADPEKITVEEIDQVLYHVGNNVKPNLLLGLLKREKWNRLLLLSINTQITGPRQELEIGIFRIDLQQFGIKMQGLPVFFRHKEKFRLQEGLLKSSLIL